MEKQTINNLVSIIVPTYKRGNDYLERCIDSLLNQTYNNIEIIIVDDNELNDNHCINTKKILEKYKNNSKVKYIKTEKNLRAALSRNLGIEYSTGDYITFLDDDDEYLKDKVKMQLEYMVQNALDMSFSDIGLYNDDGELTEYRSHDYITDLSNNALIKQHVMHNLTGTPTYMYKADRLKEIGCFDDSILSEEYYLMEKSIKRGLKIGYIPESHVIAYRHKSGGESFSDRKIEGEKLLFANKKEYFHLLSKSEIRYSKCRYYAVMAVSNYRRGKYIQFIYFSFLSFAVSPTSIIKELKKRNKLLKIHKR